MHPMSFEYAVPAAIAVLLAMAVAHWSPAFEESHPLRRYAWGVGWIAAATAGHVALDPHAPAWGALVALLIFIAAAGAGTAGAYLWDRMMHLEDVVKRGRQG